nr:MAG TPA: hypothetical protein [Caudoviricetes sp.]
MSDSFSKSATLASSKFLFNLSNLLDNLALAVNLSLSSLLV